MFDMCFASLSILFPVILRIFRAFAGSATRITLRLSPWPIPLREFWSANFLRKDALSTMKRKRDGKWLPKRFLLKSF